MIIEGNSIAECWLKILQEMIVTKKNELSPLIVNINIGGEVPEYQEELENDINKFLVTIKNQPSIESTAGTIFPNSLSAGNATIFDRYDRIWKSVKLTHKNKRGTYFRRMMAYGEAYGEPKNQLKHIIETYNGIPGKRSPVHRRSALIATTFDPILDHKPTPMLGFPCLQQVCFIPNPQNKTLQMNAIYAMQHLDTRAYGNYLGLVRLGEYMAKKMGLKFVQLQCMLSIIELGKKMNKKLALEIFEKYSKNVE